MNNYLIYPLKSDPSDVEAVYKEVSALINQLRLSKQGMSAEQLYEQWGADAANWIQTTNLDTLRFERALTQEGQLLLGLYGDKDEPTQTDPIFWTEYDV